MNSLFQINRDLRTIKDEQISSREYELRKIMVSYGYDRENAEKVYEYQRVDAAKHMFGASVGALAAYKFNPMYQEMAHRHLFFRKLWMRFPLQLSVFALAWHLSIQLPNRLAKILTDRFGMSRGVTQELMASNSDLVGRFRMFENNKSGQSAEQDIVKYLHEYSDRPFVKDELLERLRDMERKGHKMRVRRMGKDRDDIYWYFGKIHGLENIACIDDELLKKAAGDPIMLQKLVNKVERGLAKPESFERVNSNLNDSMIKFKEAAGKMGLITSDRKRILALPLYMAKRSQAPDPKRGQAEFELFTYLTGREYTEDVGVHIDKENKITEFEYEKFLNPVLLQRVNTQNDTFKNFVRETNFVTKTKHERLLENKSLFNQAMPILSALTPTEQRALIHKIQNARGRAEPGEEDAEDLYEHMVVHSAVIDEKLAKISEEENFNLKNRYRHQQKTMNFADKKRMPIHESKVADLLRNSHIYRSKIVDEVGTFEKELNNTQINNGVLTYVNEAAFGELRDLITDVGIKDDTIDFVNLAKLNKKREQMLFASDVQARYLQNALYTPLDMTDYEDTFVSWRELPGALPIAHSEKLLEFQMEDFPQVNALVEKQLPENAPVWSTGPSVTALFDTERAEPEEEEEDEEEEEGDGEYGEEEAGDEYGEEYGEEEEPPGKPAREWPDKDIVASAKQDTRVFRSDEKLRQKFSEVEIDNFMKLLAIKPHVQWQDTSMFHHKLGVHSYEDGHQEHDPDYHLLSEVERKHAERTNTKRWRKGTEVRFVVDEKQPEWSTRGY